MRSGPKRQAGARANRPGRRSGGGGQAPAPAGKPAGTPAGTSAGGGAAAAAEAAPAPTDSDADLRERLLDSRVLHRGRYLTFRIDRVERADGSIAVRDVCGHPGAVAILALDPAGNVLFVHQWRHPADGVLLEIPAGTLDVDETTGAIEDHAIAAPRELEEETGMRAGSWRLLTSFWTAPGFATELMHLYLATDLTPAHEHRLGPDEDERLRLSAIPWRVAVAMAEAGEIRHAKSLVGLLWLARLMEHGGRRGPTSDAASVPMPEVAAQMASDGQQTS